MKRFLISAAVSAPFLIAGFGCQEQPALDPTYNTTTPRADVEMHGLRNDPLGDDNVPAARSNSGSSSDTNRANGTGVNPDGTPRLQRNGINDTPAGSPDITLPRSAGSGSGASSGGTTGSGSGGASGQTQNGASSGGASGTSGSGPR